MKKLRESVWSFFFHEEGDFWLTSLRTGLGLVVAVYCLSLRGSWNLLLSRSAAGFVGRDVSEAFTTMESPWIPKVGWIVAVGQRLQLGEQTILNLLWVTLLLAAIFVVVGLCSRPAAVICWLLHLCVAKSGGLVAYGLDNFMTIGLFYLMLAPLPDRYALDFRMWARRGATEPSELGFFRRVLQLHLCLIYFFGGATKALGSGWWDGVNLWTALTRPPFDVLPPAMIARWQPLLPALGISIWLLELSYPILIWPSRTRLLWLTLICAMHLGIGFTMGMPLFAAVMLVLNVAAFGPALATSDKVQVDRPRPVSAL